MMEIKKRKCYTHLLPSTLQIIVHIADIYSDYIYWSKVIYSVLFMAFYWGYTGNTTIGNV